MINVSANAEARFRACPGRNAEMGRGISNDPYDPGGATMNGIIQVEYYAYRLRKGLPKQSVRNLLPAEREEIYRTKYWDEVNADWLPPGVELITFDFGFNAGRNEGLNAFKAALGVAADGHMGQ